MKTKPNTLTVINLGLWRVLLSLLATGPTLLAYDFEAADLRPRLIVETDAGGDPDDEGTLERLLMFSNQFDLEVIIDDRSNSQIESRSTYQTEVKNAGGNGEDLVEKYISDYGDIHANLSLHADGFPTEAALKAITVAGYDSTQAGRDALIAVIDADDPRPVWYGNWGSNSGTTSNLKRALDYVQSTRTQAAYEEFASRIRICSLDGNTSTRQGHTDVIQLHIETGYPDISGRWYHQFQPITKTAGGFDINRDVRNNHGTLGAHYTTQKEGDSWCIVHLQSQAIGLAVPTRVSWGGWGGRYAGLRTGVNFPNDAFYWNDQMDTWSGTTNRNNTAVRFAADMQHHLAARFDWGQAATYAGANHAPELVVNGDGSGAVIRLFAQPGQRVALSAAGSTDPDGDSISYEWIRYDEADSYAGAVSISGATTRDAMVTIPGDADGTDIHVYLEVSDNGDSTPAGEYPSLKAYRRVVIYVRDQLRIMPLGDSVTDGSHWSDNGNGAYRRNLWNLMQAAGWNVDLVGAKQNGGVDMDQDHEGYIGYRIDEMYGDADGTETNVELATKLDTYQPDVILLIIGANDALQNTDIPNADHRFVELLNLIYAHSPDALVVMGNVQIMEKSGYDPARGVAINGQMPGVVTAAYQLGLWPEFLDLYSLLNHPADFCADKVHPNQQGDDKIGQAFFDILVSLRATGTINIPPVADAGPDQSVFDSDGLAGESVTLDGSGSFDTDGVIVSYSWEEDGLQVATGINPAIVLGDGEHTIELLVTDDGSMSHSDMVVITVTGPPDFENPTAPTDLLASATGYDSVNLDWTASTDNLGVAFYDILEGGLPMDSIAGDETATTLTGLNPATAYTFTVRARDAWGNLSPESNTVIVVTLAAPPAYLESGGLLVMEAENFSRSTDNGDPWYAESVQTGFVGSGYVTTLDDGTANGSWETTDDLSYDFVLGTSGTYTIWMRIQQADGAGNSAHVGVDGTGGSFDNGSVTGWGWVKHGTTFSLGTGEHVFNLRRREDGYRVDRILLTTNAGYTPSGDGPAESAQGGGGSGFPVWASALISDPLKRGSNDDPELDGIPNLIEYALGLDPRIADGPGRLPAVSVNGGVLEMSYYRDASLTDIIYFVEASDNLAQWSVVYTSVGDSFATGPALFTDPEDLTSIPRFLRLHVESTGE